MVKEKDLSNLVNRYGLGYQFEKANQKYKRDPETSEKAKARKTEQQPAKLLLTWLNEHPEIYPEVRKVIQPDDFLIPLHHSVAVMMFEQLDRGESIFPAGILVKFTDAEEKKEVASLFSTRLKYEPDPEQNDKALSDIVRKVKLASIEDEMTHTNDITRWQELISQKNKIQRLDLHIYKEKNR